MNLKLLVLTFLILSLAVTPTYAQSVFRVHTTKTIILKSYTTFFFGSGIYINCEKTLQVTAFFENVTVPSFSWFNFTVGSSSEQYIYNSLLTASNVYMNGAEYAEDFTGVSDMYWSQTLGVVDIDIMPFASFPANVSIAYSIPPAPEYETVAITINAFNYSDSTSITAGSVMVDDELGNQTTISLPAMFSLVKGRTYELTFYGDSDWTYEIGRNINEAANITNPYRKAFTENTALSIYYTAIVPGELLPVPIIFIFGMVGLACMFVGPVYAINKIKEKEYRQGFVWGTILTALGFSLFIAWLFGGVF